MDVVFFESIGQTMQDLGRRSVSLFSSRHVERNRKPPSNAWSGLQPLEPRILLSGAESIGDEIVQWSHDEILIANGAEQEDAPDLVGFAQALTDAGVKFFGAAWCSHCTTQKETFEDGAGFLNFIEVTNPDRSPNQVALAEDVWGFPLWKFPDGTQVSGPQSLAALAQHSGVGIPNSNEPFIAPIDDMQLLTDSPLHVAVDGYDPNHDNLAYEVSVHRISGNAMVNAHVLEGNRSARIVVQGFGTIMVQLFEGRAGRAAQNFIELALRDFYNDKIVHRTVKDFVIQLGGVTTERPESYTGLAQTPSPLGTYRDQFHRQLQHNQPGLLSAAKAVDDGNSTDVFITAAAARGLDYQHSVFGIVVEGDDNRDAINNTATLPVQNPLAPQGEQSLPAIPVVIDRVEIFEGHENAVAMLEVQEGTFGEFEVTIEATDGHGHRFERAFKVTVAQDVVNSNPFVDDIGPVATANDAVTFDIPAVDVEGDAPTFFANKVGDVDYDLTVDASTGEVTLTPPTGFLGTVTVEVGVEQPTALDPFDREVAEILFEPHSVENGRLTITGSDFDDVIELNPGAPGEVEVAGATPGDARIYTNVTEIVVLGGGGNDRITVGPGVVDIDGKAIMTILNGQDGDDELLAGDGDDTLIGGPGNDLLDGGDGSDTADYQDDPKAINVTLMGDLDGAAKDGQRGKDHLRRIENVIGTDYNDRISGDEHDNVIAGGDGNDTIFGRGGDDVIDAGNGNDRVTTLDGDDEITAHAGQNKISAGDGADTITTGDGSDKIHGGDGMNVIHAGAGNNRIDTGSGSDRIDSGDGNDKIKAGDGDNIIYAGGGNNRIDTGSGSDHIEAADGDDKIKAGDGDNIIDAGGGNNRIDTGSDSDRIEAGNGDDKIKAGDGDNVIYAGDGNNKIDTGVGDDTIQTGLGDDKIKAKAGTNTIDAGDGNNKIDCGDGNDTITTGAGHDMIKARSGNNTIQSGDGNNKISTGTGDDDIACGHGNDTVKTNDGDKTIAIVGGVNKIDTRGGNDRIETGSGDDKIKAGDGDNFIRAGDGHNTIATGNGDDDILTGNGDDSIKSGAGNDVIDAGRGVNSLKD